MPTTDYAIKTRTHLGPADAEVRVRTALSAEGFGVVTEIDMAKTLRDKLGVERPPYRILGACRPQLASELLRIEPEAGLLLPCNVAIYVEDGSTVVSAIDPETMIDPTGDPRLAPLVLDAKERLARVLASFGDR
jgi:uncharacterized protein (DUF302 family)